MQKMKNNRKYIITILGLVSMVLLGLNLPSMAQGRITRHKSAMRNAKTSQQSQKPQQKEIFTQGIAIDLGLSVLWCSHNLGASSPEGKGGMYALNEGWDYTDRNSNPSLWNKKEGEFDGSISGTNFDHATALMGEHWRTPTFYEMVELIKKCKWKLCSYKGVRGYKITGPNGRNIFLPCTGNDFSGSKELNFGRYWQGSLRFHKSVAPILRFGIYNNIILSGYNNSEGVSYDEYLHVAHAIRPVKDK